MKKILFLIATAMLMACSTDEFDVPQNASKSEMTVTDSTTTRINAKDSTNNDTSEIIFTADSEWNDTIVRTF